jgi:hypothetical protein
VGRQKLRHHHQYHRSDLAQHDHPEAVSVAEAHSSYYASAVTAASDPPLAFFAKKKAVKLLQQQRASERLAGTDVVVGPASKLAMRLKLQQQ